MVISMMDKILLANNAIDLAKHVLEVILAIPVPPAINSILDINLLLHNKVINAYV